MGPPDLVPIRLQLRIDCRHVVHSARYISVSYWDLTHGFDLEYAARLARAVDALARSSAARKDVPFRVELGEESSRSTQLAIECGAGAL